MVVHLIPLFFNQHNPIAVARHNSIVMVKACNIRAVHFSNRYAPSVLPSAWVVVVIALDNAVTERFFRSLKSERVNYRQYQTRQQAMEDIADYIEPFYNRKRRHSTLGNISPVKYEQKYQKKSDFASHFCWPLHGPLLPAQRIPVTLTAAFLITYNDLSSLNKLSF